MAQLETKNGVIDAAQARIEARAAVLVLRCAAMIAQQKCLPRQALVRGYDCARVTERSDIFTRVEAESADSTDRHGALAQRRTGGMCAVFDHDHVAPPAASQTALDCADVDHVAEQVHR